jgi:SAM-dependent methyltransferase
MLIEKYLPRPGRFLDFGSGPGHFGKMLQKNGWEVENEDISYEKGESHLIMRGHRPVLDYPADYFDAVSLWYVIEHMVDPRSTLNEIKRVLRPGGVLILSQQNFDSIQAKFFGPSWLILDPPRHVYQFSPSNLCMLAEQHGFRKIGVKHSCLELGPFTILQSTLNKLLGNGNYLFKLLKNSKLRIKSIRPEERERIILLGASSIVLSVVLAPLSMLAYHILLRAGSGDVFTLVLKNQVY